MVCYLKDECILQLFEEQEALIDCVLVGPIFTVATKTLLLLFVY
jgi:hypothetical protein